MAATALEWTPREGMMGVGCSAGVGLVTYYRKVTPVDAMQKKAVDFLERTQGFEFGDYAKEFRALTPKEQDAVQKLRYGRHRQEIAAYFVPENADEKSRHEHSSPDGKFKLVVTNYRTQPKSWNYSRGVVYRRDSQEALFEVQRNYGHFPFTWVEHPNGHIYLICGEDYQGQTVLEVDTAKRVDYVPLEEALGHGFCWAASRFDAATRILVVCGCHWACPYEYRFYDFSNPMAGWPEITLEDGYIEDDDEWPSIEENGIVRCFATAAVEGEGANGKREKRAITTLRREGHKLVMVSEWVSDAESARREETKKARLKREAEIAEFQATDTLYLAYLDLVKDPALSPEDHPGVGVTFEKWCPHWKGKERRWTRRIVSHRGKVGYSIDLEWACQSGPIKLVIYRDGRHIEDKWFEHSVAGMTQAFKAARLLVSTPPPPARAGG